ncbi:MAG: hypothetical protein JOY71_02120 [Acetobacteraceae bacterium]|nr:hypothetical protein [Acetobacteraceae bacterium]
MTGEGSATGNTNQTMSIGGSAAGIVQQAGTGNTATATGTVSAGAPPEVLKALLAIQAELSGHPATKALTDAAVEQAKAAEPDKKAIGSQLKAAFDVAKTTLGWAEIAEKLAPFARIAAGWLGGDWGNQLTL